MLPLSSSPQPCGSASEIAKGFFCRPQQVWNDQQDAWSQGDKGRIARDLPKTLFALLRSATLSQQPLEVIHWQTIYNLERLAISACMPAAHGEAHRVPSAHNTATDSLGPFASFQSAGATVCGTCFFFFFLQAEKRTHALHRNTLKCCLVAWGSQRGRLQAIAKKALACAFQESDQIYFFLKENPFSWQSPKFMIISNGCRLLDRGVRAGIPARHGRPTALSSLVPPSEFAGLLERAGELFWGVGGGGARCIRRTPTAFTRSSPAGSKTLKCNTCLRLCGVRLLGSPREGGKTLSLAGAWVPAKLSILAAHPSRNAAVSLSIDQHCQAVDAQGSFPHPPLPALPLWR